MVDYLGTVVLETFLQAAFEQISEISIYGGRVLKEEGIGVVLSLRSNVILLLSLRDHAIKG